jgi:23S rRNA A1618 N6-methylase RlmF
LLFPILSLVIANLHFRIQACTGAPVEMITPGGETAFVRAMVLESVGILNKDRKKRHASDLDEDTAEPAPKQRRTEESISQAQPRQYNLTSSSGLPGSYGHKTIRWYTSMFGKLSSVVDVVATIKEQGVCRM